MKILLISYGDIGYDGRLRSLISVFSRMGKVYSFTRGAAPINEYSEVNNSAYVKFIEKSVQFAKGVGRFEWLVLDNRKATIPGMIIMKICKPAVVIQDCRELYLLNEVKHITGKIGCLFEKMMVRKANIVICANQERCEIMQKEYNLTKPPIPYENLRMLEYESEEALERAKKKLEPYFHEDEIRIVSSSGCSIKRTNDVLVRNLNQITKKCRLFLVGDSTFEEKRVIEKIVSENYLKNVEILGRLNQTELKYLISRSHIGIVNYGKYDTNNRLCASGKLYEFIYEGIPVVTTTNPPLKRLCEKEGIGIADDEYADAINEIIINYEKYLQNVNIFSVKHTIKGNDEQLIKEIRKNSRNIARRKIH